MTTLAAEAITRTSTGEAVLFWVLGVVAVTGALGVVMAAKAVYSAMFLAMTMLILAVFYIAQDALFLGVVQVVVYTGAVMMLFLFVLMFVGVDSGESLVETIRGQRISAFAAGIGCTAPSGDLRRCGDRHRRCAARRGNPPAAASRVARRTAGWRAASGAHPGAHAVCR